MVITEFERESDEARCIRLKKEADEKQDEKLEQEALEEMRKSMFNYD